MKKIYLLAIVALLSSCMKQVENPTESGTQPEIFPDYVGVTIPAGIAPMDFGMKDDAFTLVDVVATGSKGGELHVQGEYADFDVEEWHDLTERNIGGQILDTLQEFRDEREPPSPRRLRNNIPTYCAGLRVRRRHRHLPTRHTLFRRRADVYRRCRSGAMYELPHGQPRKCRRVSVARPRREERNDASAERQADVAQHQDRQHQG